MTIDIGSPFTILTTDPLFEAGKLSGGIIVVDSLSTADAHDAEFRKGRMYIARSTHDVRLYSSDGSTYETKTGTLVGAQVKALLEGLTGDARLDASAVKGIPAPADLTSIEAEIARLKTDISDEILPVFTWRDKGVPAALPTSPQRAYYLSTIVLPDNLQSITLPGNAPEGAIFSYENNDRNDYVTLRPPAGMTINGASSSYQAGFDTLNFFIKEGTDWKLVYSGVFPNNLTALKSTIQAALPNDLHTIDEIAAQLKDRLHTFREIQTEFASQLHTVDALRGSGFIQRECDYGIYSAATVPPDRAWVLGTESMNAPFTVRFNASEYLLLLMPAVVAGFVAKVFVDGAEAEFSVHDFPVTGSDGTQKLLMTNDPVPANTDLKIWFEWGVDTSGIDTGGIEIDDGTSDAASITKINLKGAKITELPSQGTMAPGEVEVTAGPSVHMYPDAQYGLGIVTEIEVEPPLNVYDSPTPNTSTTLRMGIEHDAFEPMHKPSFLAYLKEDEEVVGKIPPGSGGANTAKSHHDGAIWLDDIVWPAGAYISTDRARKTYGIQEADQLDPNVSGGTDYLIAFRAHFKGNAPSDGFVRIYLYNKSIDPFSPTGYLTDVNSDPMVVQRNYKTGEALGFLDVIGVVNAKGLQSFTCHVVDTFENDILMLTDRTEGATGLMIQALTSESKTGDGLQQFELDTNQNIQFSSHYLGVDRMTLGYITSRAESPVSYTAGTNWNSVNGFYLTNRSGLKVGIVDSRVVIEDDGVHMIDFNFGTVFSAEETQMLRGKVVTVTVTHTNQNCAFQVGLAKWTGKPDEYTTGIIDSWNNVTPVTETNWAIADNFEVVEDVSAVDTVTPHEFTVPADANNYTILVYPSGGPVLPFKIELKEIKLDVKVPFIGYVLHAPEMLNEIHLYFDKEYKQFSQDNQGYASLRYTINNTELPAPCGIDKKGAAKITLNTSYNQVAGSNAKGGEGALEFGADGTATIHTQLRLWNEQVAASTTEFWWAEVTGDAGSPVYTKIDDSEGTFDVPPGAKGVIFRLPTLKKNVENGDKLALRMTTDSIDGAFLESTSPDKPMVLTTIQFEELVASGNPGDDPNAILDAVRQDRAAAGDTVYTAELTGSHEFASASSATIVFGDGVLPAGSVPMVKKAYKKTSTGVRSVTKQEEAWNPTTRALTVSFGETAETLVIWEVIA